MRPEAPDEMIRLAGALERVEPERKVEAEEWLVARVEAEGPAPHLLWAIGRLGARVPFHASAHLAVSAEAAEAWIARLLALPVPRRELVFPLAQLARRSGDRVRDVADDVRARALGALADSGAPAEALRAVREVAEASADRSSGSSASLPAGLRLVEEGHRVIVHDAARRFDGAAGAYERGRPEYPRAAIDLLVRALPLAPATRLLDLGAGTGKLASPPHAAHASSPSIRGRDAAPRRPAHQASRRLRARRGAPAPDGRDGRGRGCLELPLVRRAAGARGRSTRAAPGREARAPVEPARRRDRLGGAALRDREPTRGRRPRYRRTTGGARSTVRPACSRQSRRARFTHVHARSPATACSIA